MSSAAESASLHYMEVLGTAEAIASFASAEATRWSEAFDTATGKAATLAARRAWAASEVAAMYEDICYGVEGAFEDTDSDNREAVKAASAAVVATRRHEAACNKAVAAIIAATVVDPSGDKPTDKAVKSADRAVKAADKAARQARAAIARAGEAARSISEWAPSTRKLPFRDACEVEYQKEFAIAFEHAYENGFDGSSL